MSGCGTRAAHSAAASTSTAPDQRSGVRNRPSRMMPRLAAINGPMPNAGTRPTAPGKAATHCVTADHPVDAEAHDRPEQAIEAERHRDEPEQARRHHQRRHHRHRRQIGQHAIGRDAVKVKRRIGHGREPRHQRCQQQHREFAATPQRRTRGCGVIGGCEQAGHADLHQRHQAERGRKRHLETRMHQRFRRDCQHDQGRDRKRAKRDRPAIDHHRDQHHGRHEERALGGHFRARQQQIERGGGERRRPPTIS